MTKFRRSKWSENGNSDICKSFGFHKSKVRKKLQYTRIKRHRLISVLIKCWKRTDMEVYDRAADTKFLGEKVYLLLSHV
jgi:hypothetical protein